MKRTWIGALLISLFILGLAVTPGCPRRPEEPERRPGPVQPAPVQPGQPAPTPGQNLQGANQKADMIARRVAEMRQINSATVVLSGNSAWVGVDLHANVERELSNATKDEITRIVKAEDNNINTVYVTADADTVTRLRNIARDIAAGRPVSGFAEQLAEIARRITPSAR